jgi:hypothetical protein
MAQRSLMELPDDSPAVMAVDQLMSRVREVIE